jgi:phosphate transport system substrate-binding protein
LGNTVNWPASDKFIKSPKNDGVTATVRQTPGAIGYIEYGFAKLAKVDFAQLQNKAGQYVVPNAESGAEALAAVNMPENLVAWLPDRTVPSPTRSLLHLDDLPQGQRQPGQGQGHA